MLNKIHKESPMVIYFCCLAMGICLVALFNINHWVVFNATILLFLVSIVVKNKYSDYLHFLLIIMLGMLAVIYYQWQDETHLSNFKFPSDNYHITGIVSKRRVFPDKIKFVLKNVRIEDKKFSGKILTTIKNPNVAFFNNDTIGYVGSVYFPDGARNPGEFDYKNYLNKKNIFLLSYADKHKNYTINTRKSFSLISFSEKVKTAIIHKIDESLSGEPADILKALITGARDELDRTTTELFVHSGTIHILAVSGLHVGYVTLSLLVIFTFFRLPDKPKTIAIIIGLILYIFIVDFKASVVRAVIMATIILIGKSWERKMNVYNSLAAAGFIQLLFIPMQLFDAGFQLSYSAVFSIVYFYRKLDDFIPVNYMKWQFLLKYIYQLFIVSLAAIIGTLPITAFYFNRISPVGLIANLFAIPLIGLIGAAGFGQIILGFIIPTVNLVYGQVNQLLILLLIKMTYLSSLIPFGSIRVPSLNLLQILLIYIMIFGLFNLTKRKVRVAYAIGILILFNCHIWMRVFHESKLEVIFFDVSQGDAALVKFPSGEKMLIDAADRTFSRNYAKMVIHPYLIRENIRHLDVLALSHPHSDHIGGAPYLLENISIGEIWESDVIAKSKTFQQYHQLAESRNIPIKKIYAGDYFSYGKCQLFVLHPSQKYIETEPNNFNNYSTVIKLSYDDTDILFTGDIEKEDEAYVTLFDEFIDCEILKVPHHGSNTSSTQKFIHTVNPDIAFISVGRKNKFNHPSKKKIDLYLNKKVIVHRSDQQHYLKIESIGRNYNISHE